MKVKLEFSASDQISKAHLLGKNYRQEQQRL